MLCTAYSSSFFQRKQAKVGLVPDLGPSRRRPALSLQYQNRKLSAEVQQKLVQLQTFSTGSMSSSLPATCGPAAADI